MIKRPYLKYSGLRCPVQEDGIADGSPVLENGMLAFAQDLL
jgi:hypothetical protein